MSNLSFELHPGERLVVVGLSGSGKSTLARLLVGLESPTCGTISSRSPPGIVFQEAALFDFDDLTVADNLTLAGATDPASLLRSVDLPESLMDRRPSQLSGGQRRRVAIARALAANPSTLIYDEPTAGLDTRSARTIAELIRRAATERNLATILITHDLEVAVHVADQIMFLPTCGGPLRQLLSPMEVTSIRDEIEALAAEQPAPSDYRPVPRRPKPGPSPYLTPFAAIGTAVLLAAGSLSVARPGAIRRRLLSLAPGAIALSLAGSLSVGFVIALQSAAALNRFEAAHLLPEIAPASMVREVLPLLIGLLLAGRIGAAVAAEMGSYSLSGQIAALRLLGKSPEPFLASPLLWAVGLVVPLATAAGLTAGAVGLVAGASGVLGLKASLVLAGLQHAVRPDDVLLALLKSLTFGLAIAVASYRHGITPKSDPSELGAGATRGVVEASLAVVLLDCLITQLTHR